MISYIIIDIKTPWRRINTEINKDNVKKYSINIGDNHGCNTILKLDNDENEKEGIMYE